VYSDSIAVLGWCRCSWVIHEYTGIGIVKWYTNAGVIQMYRGTGVVQGYLCKEL
jgi:hypothetical protein